MYALQKESPRHAPTWNRGKNQQHNSFVPQNPAQVNDKGRDCFMCAYFQRFGLNSTAARTCAFSGRIVYGRFIESGCIGFHDRPGMACGGE